jgi:predicted nucleic acid-binding protein
LFLDTSALLAVFDKGEKDHEICKEIWQRIVRAQSHVLYTRDYILDEAATRLRTTRFNAEKVVGIIQALLRLAEKDALNIIWVQEDQFQSALQKMAQLNDQILSFTDCVSFILCEQSGIGEAFTLDEDFDKVHLVIGPSDAEREQYRRRNNPRRP